MAESSASSVERSSRSDSASRTSAFFRSVRSRVTLAKPTSRPASSRIGVIATFARNAEPSLLARGVGLRRLNSERFNIA
jgi:hypothetical protein